MGDFSDVTERRVGPRQGSARRPQTSCAREASLCGLGVVSAPPPWGGGAGADVTSNVYPLVPATSGRPAASLRPHATPRCSRFRSFPLKKGVRYSSCRDSAVFPGRPRSLVLQGQREARLPTLTACSPRIRLASWQMVRPVSPPRGLGSLGLHRRGAGGGWGAGGGEGRPARVFGLPHAQALPIGPRLLPGRLPDINFLELLTHLRRSWGVCPCEEFALDKAIRDPHVCSRDLDTFYGGASGCGTQGRGDMEERAGKKVHLLLGPWVGGARRALRKSQPGRPRRISKSKFHRHTCIRMHIHTRRLHPPNRSGHLIPDRSQIKAESNS